MAKGVEHSVASLETAFGTLWLAASARGLCRLALPSAKERARFEAWVERHGPQGEQGMEILALAKTEVHDYLAGARRHFTVPLDLEGSEFFRRVWDVLLSIPYGHTLTYTALAANAQRPRAVRAAGAACALNPVPLIIPCHRAVGSNGSLTGFGGGLAMKEALLRMEGALAGKGTQ
jgi:O-6-methylguanine DNA methyltransferase